MTRMGVTGAVIGGRWVPGDISIRDGLIDQVGLPPGSTGLAIPGFVDLQVNGFHGVDFASATAEEWAEANGHLARTGVTRYLANLISSAPAVIDRALEVAREVRRDPEHPGARLAGVHLEGPFLAEKKAGIHQKEHLTEPNWALLERWMTAGPVAMATIAPELPGAIQVIRQLRDKGVVVSLGHSNATVTEAIAGFDQGATTVTHLFNAMSGITARDPGLAGAALSRADVWVQLILDFLHVDRVLAQIIATLASERLVLVTDCLPITGTTSRQFPFGGSDIDLVEGKAVNSDGVLAGSVLLMDQALRNAVGCGMSVVDAVNATSRNPLSVLNHPVDDLLAPGTPADVLIVSDALDLDKIFHRGVEHDIWEGV
jgi:N-acetylglucosamine-6-phosphate deacetylase